VHKVRKIDYRADEMIAGVAGQLEMVEFAVYSMVCNLIYSQGRAIPDDAEWIARLFKGTNPRSVRAPLDRLIAKGKIIRTEVESTSNEGRKTFELMVNRCRIELEAAANRVRTASENGAKGGRPSKENNDVEKPGGSTPANQDEKLTLQRTNEQTNKLSPDALLDLEFEAWYAEYPLKKSRAPGRKAFTTARKKASLEELLQGVRRYIAECRRLGTQPAYMKHPATWLNSECWKDETTSAQVLSLHAMSERSMLAR